MTKKTNDILTFIKKYDRAGDTYKILERNANVLDKVFKDSLTKKEKNILKERIKGQTLSKVGEKEKLTKERVRQLEARAVEKLKMACLGENQAAVYYKKMISDIGLNKKELESMSAKEFLDYVKRKEEDLETCAKDFSIKWLSFSRRTYNALDYKGIRTVSDLIKYSPNELKQIRGLGETCLEEIKRVLLKKLNLRLKEDR